MGFVGGRLYKYSYIIQYMYIHMHSATGFCCYAVDPKLAHENFATAQHECVQRHRCIHINVCCWQLTAHCTGHKYKR